MAQFLVLADYQDTARKLPAGSLIDDTQVDMTVLRNAGLAAVPYNATTMGAARERYLSQKATGEFAKPDLLLLIILSTAGASVVNTSTGASTESRLNP